MVLLAVQLVLGGALVFAATQGWFGGSDHKRQDPPARAATPFVPAATVHRFDGPRAFAELRAQVRMGPRPAGSATSRRLAERLRRELPRGRFEAVPGGLRNVVGRIPGRPPAIVVGAHYDTKDIPNFVGANDGAGGTAGVVELARDLDRSRGSGRHEIRFVLFDGEESPPGCDDFMRCGDRGSKQYARRHAREVGSMVLLDFVANHGLRLPRDLVSDRRLWSRLRAAGRRVGVGAIFPNRTQPAVEDDDTPFSEAGIPAVDLIDFDYPCWHRPCDDLAHVSERSLDAAGEAVLELLRGM